MIKILKELEPILAQEYKVARIGVFGSLVRGEQTEKNAMWIYSWNFLNP